MFWIKNEKGDNIFDVLINTNNGLDYIYALAEAHAIDLIAKTIAKCEIQTFTLNKEKKIEEEKGDTYWRLNIQPNYNETGTMFWYKLVTKLLTNKRALIIINKDKNSKLLYVADDFKMSDKLLYEKTFTNISLSDNEGNSMQLRKPYTSEDAIYYSIENMQLRTAKELYKEKTSKLLKTISNSFIKSNTPKWRLKTPGTQPRMLDAETQKPITYEEYKQKITDGLLSEEETIILLAQAFELENLNKDKGKDLTDYGKIVKEIGDTVASSWNIPLDIFYGNKTEKSTGNEDFITFAIAPYFKIIEDGINIGLIGKKDYLKGEYARFNRMNINHRDIIDSANGIDKLTADGFSRNEINKILGLPKINESWADEHYITKNYSKGGAKEVGE